MHVAARGREEAVFHFWIITSLMSICCTPYAIGYGLAVLDTPDLEIKTEPAAYLSCAEQSAHTQRARALLRQRTRCWHYRCSLYCNTPGLCMCMFASSYLWSYMLGLNTETFARVSGKESVHVASASSVCASHGATSDGLTDRPLGMICSMRPFSLL